MPVPDRAAALAALGASPGEVDELLAYTANHFHPEAWPPEFHLPLAPEPYVAVWESYAVATEATGSIEPLRDVLVQLRFPIREGISGEDAYRAVVRRGEPPPDDLQGIVLRGPVRVILHPHPAGAIPALIVSAREDFVALLRAIASRNEPAPVPDSQGATVISGYNNWDRVRRHRLAWAADHPDATDDDWEEEFANLIAETWRYQDRFLIVSSGPYSGVPASEMNLDDAGWRRDSVALRLEHEAAHYFTRRVLGSMKDQIHDELIADWAGIRAAAGCYRADWFLRFMGLEAFPSYRAGGRLQNYRSSPAPLSDGAFRILQVLTTSAAHNLERFDRAHVAGAADRRQSAIGLITLASVTLDLIASADGCDHLERAWRDAERRVRWAD